MGDKMIYTEQTKKALQLCFEIHKNQVDKSGLPYVFHPYHLAEQMDDEESILVALLHDVVEDSEITFEDLEKYGFSENVMDAIKRLTHTNPVDYDDYIEKIKMNPIAVKVKLADLRHNSDLNRLEKVSQKDLKRAERYQKAIERLLEQ